MQIKKNLTRRNIKKLSFEEPKGTLAKALLFFLLITSLINFGIVCFVRDYGYDMKSSLYNSLITLLTFIIVSPLFLNFIKMFLTNSKDELISFRDLFKFNKSSFKFLWYFALVSLGYFIINLIFSLLSVVGIIINIILLIILVPVFFIMPYIFLENDNLSFKDFLEKSFKLVSGKRIEFYGFILSFTFWFILGILTFGLLYFWLIPYFLIAFTYLYLSFKAEKEFEKQNILSNEIVIIIFIIGFILINIISFVVFPESFNDFKKIININNYDSSLVYGGTKINYKAPKNYELVSKGSTSKTYTNNDNIVQYSIYLASTDEVIEMDKQIVKEYKESNDYKQVASKLFKMKVNNKNIKGYSYKLVKDKTSSNVVIAYYPKDNFVIAVSLSSTKNLKNNDIKDFITIED